MIHSVHFTTCAVIHSAHAHIGHGEKRCVTKCRDRRARTGPTCQGRYRHARSVHRFSYDRHGFAGWLNDKIIGFRRADLELFDRDRAHILPICCYDMNTGAGNADVKKGHRTPVDYSDAYPFSGIEEELEALHRTMSVGQICVGRTCHIEDVRWHHPHFRPHTAIFAAQWVVICPGSPLVVEIALAFLQFVHDRVRMHRRKFAEQQDIVAIGLHRIRTGRFNDDWSIMARLFLQA